MLSREKKPPGCVGLFDTKTEMKAGKKKCFPSSTIKLK